MRVEDPLRYVEAENEWLDLLGIEAHYYTRLTTAQRARMDWMVTATGAAMVAAWLSGCFLGWVTLRSVFIALVLGTTCALIIWNLHRLGFAVSAIPPWYDSYGVDKWRPQWGMAVVTGGIGAIVVQIPISVWLMGWYSDELDAYKQAMVEDFRNAATSAFDRRITELETKIRELPVDGKGKRFRENLIAEQLAMINEKTRVGDEAVSEYRKHLKQTVLVAASTRLAWNHPFGMFLFSLFAFLLFSGPALLRVFFASTIRSFSVPKQLDIRNALTELQIETDRNVHASLSKFSSFSGVLSCRYHDPPFNREPLIHGMVRGTVIDAANDETLASSIPGFCSPTVDEETLSRIREADLAIWQAETACIEFGGRNQRWDFVRLLLTRASTEPNTERGRRAENRALDEILSLHRTSPPGEWEAESLPIFTASPIPIGFERECSVCGCKSDDSSRSCSICTGPLSVILCIGTSRASLV